jgi:Na+-driven multidrug efflux pump
VSLDPRTKALIDGPIAPTLLRLALPNVFMTMVQASTGLIEAYFIGWLGTDALAGVALVFPGLMLMQMMSAGAMGGGVSSAVARALGAGRRDEANAIVLHTLLIASGFALTFTVAMLAGGSWPYAALGGRGVAALFPTAWLMLFARDPAVLVAGSSYLQVVGPFYGFFGLGMALYFASQGAGTMVWPLLAA